MSARRRHKAHHEEEHENEERWLVSFADMMTLLFCLFMVLFAISSVNTSKFEALQRALQDAFSGKILSGGKAIQQSGNNEEPKRPSAEPPVAAISPLGALGDVRPEQTAAKREEESFKKLKRRIDDAVAKEGLTGRVETTIRRRGLVVELLTDNVFFDPGEAKLKPPAVRLLGRLARVLRTEGLHPIVVEGHTDAQPISTPKYPSNWELSGARAAAVVRTFTAGGVIPGRMSLAGYGAEDPVAGNSTPDGRSKNRRVDVILTRLHQDQETTP
jgi:chemotaxis protein MotB